MITVTGYKGTIGHVIQDYLSEKYPINGVDLPEVDVLNLDSLNNAVKGSSTIIHLAWDKRVNFDTNEMGTENLMMINNVYHSAVSNNVSRVIFASSVHADDFYTKPVLEPNTPPKSTGYYGVCKVYGELLGGYYASAFGIEVINIRFGGVVWNNQPDRNDTWDKRVWLDREDCAELIDAVLATPVQKGRNVILYAVSHNEGRVHDITNPFGWSPRHGQS